MFDEIIGNLENNDAEKADLKLLISEAQNGKQTACAELLRRYDPLITSMAQKSFADGMTEQDFEDLKQEASFYFCNALNTYDAAQDDVGFGLYAKICIGNALKSALRVYNRRVDKSLFSSEDDIEKIISQLPSDDDVSSPIIEKEEYYKLYTVIKNSLSPLENSVWWMYASGVSVAKIAAKLSASEKSVSNAIYRIRRKLRKVIGDRV